MPMPIDNFTDMASRGIKIIDEIVVNEMGGGVEQGKWVIPQMTGPIVRAQVSQVDVAWTTIEDSDPRWTKSGFETRNGQWNASGATLTVGTSDCSAEINQAKQSSIGRS